MGKDIKKGEEREMGEAVEQLREPWFPEEPTQQMS